MIQQTIILCLVVILLILIYKTNYDKFTISGSDSGFSTENRIGESTNIPITDIRWLVDANNLEIQQNNTWKRLESPQYNPVNMCVNKEGNEICLNFDEITKLKNMLGDSQDTWPNSIGSKEICLGKNTEKECIDKDKLSNINTLLDSNSVKDNTEIYLQSFSNKGKWLRHERNNYAKFNTSSSELPTNSNMKFILRTV